MKELYRCRKVRIGRNHPMFPYCSELTAKANNLANAVRFRQRQVMTAVKKSETEWSDNEREVMNEIRYASGKTEKFSFSPDKDHAFMSCGELDKLMKATANSDYYAPGLPRQSAQWVIKQSCQEMKAFFAAVKVWRTNPSSFTGKPELPGYKRKGGHSLCHITNQDSRLKEKDGNWELKLPLTKQRLSFGPAVTGGVHKETRITPDNGTYVISLIYTITGTERKEKPSKRIAAIDFGVDNLMAVTNNCNLPFILYKGGVAKSINHHYNKTMARIMSEETAKEKKHFVPTRESQRITTWRNDSIRDFMHKSARHLIRWCVENRIDTIVAGVNKGWKQEVNMGRKNNQEFVGIPFWSLRFMLSYLCEEHGIRYVEQEESYTSQASFLDRDVIPTYDEKEQHYVFSGKRKPLFFHGQKKSGGFRGLYVSKDGTIINSDLNGSANILRKVFPDAFGAGMPAGFFNVEIIKHPDWKPRDKKQHVISKSKARRMRRKSSRLNMNVTFNEGMAS